jgi:hypothetical protein
MTKNKLKIKLWYKEIQLNVSQNMVTKHKELCLILQQEINQIHQQMILEAKLANKNMG